MIIIVSGSSGTGKTTIAKRLAKEKKLEYLDVNKIIKEYDLTEGYDKKLKTNIVDVNKLNKTLVKIIKKKKNLVIDSHLSHYLPKKYVDLCIITKCSIKKLRARLKKRNYSKNKIQENINAENFDTCLNEAKEFGHKVKVIYT